MITCTRPRVSFATAAHISVSRLCRGASTGWLWYCFMEKSAALAVREITIRPQLAILWKPRLVIGFRDSLGFSIAKVNDIYLSAKLVQVGLGGDDPWIPRRTSAVRLRDVRSRSR